MNIEAYLKDYLGYAPKIRGSEDKQFVNLPCPDCNYDSDVSRQIWVHISGQRKGRWGCWRCEKYGDFVRLIAHLEQVTYNRAKKRAKLYEKLYMMDAEQEFEDILQVNAKHSAQTSSFSVYEDFIPGGMVDIGKGKAYRYLQSRGFGEKEVKEWGLKYCTSGRYKHRIMIPVRSTDGRYIRAWQGRAISNCIKPSYLATSENEGTNIKELLLNAHRADKKLWILTEGWMDVLAVGSKYGVCSLGKGLSLAQRQIIREVKPGRVLVAYDGDASIEAEAVATDLRCYCDASVVEMPYGDDPASLGQKKFCEYLKNCEKL